jgi:tetratricopeptide (TPR) repeat protein
LLIEYLDGRTLLLLVENMDDLFDGLGTEGQQRLRAYLQENPFCTILATSQSLFNGVSLQTSPFYGFFRIHHLDELELDGAVDLLTHLAEHDNDSELARFIGTPTGRARVRTIHHLAGGNHRVYVILAQFLTRESLDDLIEPFLSLLDDLTPYYQARMAWLSPQQRKMVNFLCDYSGASPVKEIARRCFMTHQTASGQLKKLQEWGYVRSTAVGRESFYELREPLMRLGIEVKKHRGEPIRLFVDFLRLWYSREELRERLEMLGAEAALERTHLLHALQENEEDTEAPWLASYLNDFNRYIKASNFAGALKVANQLVNRRGRARDRFAQAYCLSNLGHHNEALGAYNRGLELAPDDMLAEANRGVTLLNLGHWDEAFRSFNRVIEYDPNNQLAWIGRGGALENLKHYAEALICFEKVINELDNNNALAWGGRGLTLIDIGHYDEALASCEKAIELGEQSSYVFFDRAVALLALNCWDEGYAALDDALHRFAHVAEIAASRAKYIVRNLLTNRANGLSISRETSRYIVHNLLSSTDDVTILQERITDLITLYKKHQVLADLGQGLVKSIAALFAPTTTDTAAQTWRDIWHELGKPHKELQIPLRLLGAAVTYRATQDRRVLLRLPSEERKVLEQVLAEVEASAE